MSIYVAFTGCMTRNKYGIKGLHIEWICCHVRHHLVSAYIYQLKNFSLQENVTVKKMYVCMFLTQGHCL